jgi:hypothetical protein
MSVSDEQRKKWRALRQLEIDSASSIGEACVYCLFYYWRMVTLSDLLPLLKNRPEKKCALKPSFYLMRVKYAALLDHQKETGGRHTLTKPKHMRYLGMPVLELEKELMEMRNESPPK